MPLCTLHLLSLVPTTSIPAFLSLLSSQSPPVKPLLASRVVRWIITPTTITATELLHPPYPWDLLILLSDTTPLPSSLSTHIRNAYTLMTGIPSRITSTFVQDNPKLLHPATTPKLQAAPSTSSKLPSSSQNLELSPQLVEWIESFTKTVAGAGPVSMLNLLAFHPTHAAKQNYQAYGRAFAESIGSRHGGNAKIVGNVVNSQQQQQQQQGLSAASSHSSDFSAAGWQEIAIAQYPTISHFAAMLGSKDYQEVNQKYRVPSLRDTCILCTSEIAVEEDVKEWKTRGERARL